MSMARFETGPGGNAHYHGFNVGTPGPQVLRVKADVEGDGDERLGRSTRPVCLMVTPSFSADCANVEHASHESYARAAVIAYWRHMATEDRHAVIRDKMHAPLKVVPEVCFGTTAFRAPLPSAVSPETQRYLGVRDLFHQFEGRIRDGRGRDVGWGLGLMEMLTDPLLLQWVPAWVVEQYERANPFFREALTVVLGQGVNSNKALLRRAKREMIRRHRRLLKKKELQKQKEAVSSEEDSDGVDGSGEGGESESVAEEAAKDLHGKLLDGAEDDPQAEQSSS